MSLLPILSCTIEDVDSKTVSLTGNKNVLIKFHSDAKVTVSAQAQGGAAIDGDMYTILGDGGRVLGNTHTFVDTWGNSFTVSAQDSMGRYNRETFEAQMIEYVKLTCNIRRVSITGSGSAILTCYGNCFTGSFGSKTNRVTVSYRYRKSGGTWSSIGYMTVDASNNYYTATADLTGLDFAATYDFEVTASDELEEVTSSVKNITSTPAFHWGKDDVVFEVPVTFKAGAEGATPVDKIDGDLNITGNLRLKGSGNFGNKLNFGDGEYCFLEEKTDDELTIKAKTLDLAATTVKINGNTFSSAESGEWTPSLSVSASYSYNDGWYTKIGDVVTVGFYVKASTYSGSDDELITIEGLPYDPLRVASGGGICSGALISTNKNFQCFVAETDGTITTRAQDCDETSGAVLSTSASACYYPGSGQITLSGTITYLT
jgi:hypothetical protein